MIRLSVHQIVLSDAHRSKESVEQQRLDDDHPSQCCGGTEDANKIITNELIYLTPNGMSYRSISFLPVFAMLFDGLIIGIAFFKSCSLFTISSCFSQGVLKLSLHNQNFFSE